MRHGLVETEAETVITSSELLGKFVRILSDSEDKVRTIIYFDNPAKRTRTEGFRSNVRLISYWDVISLGKKTANNNMDDVNAEPSPPTPDTPAIIMYTSGSTGQYRSTQVSTGQHRSTQVSTGQHKSVQVNTGQYRSVQGSTGQHKSVQVNTGQYRSTHSPQSFYTR